MKQIGYYSGPTYELAYSYAEEFMSESAVSAVIHINQDSYDVYAYKKDTGV